MAGFFHPCRYHTTTRGLTHPGASLLHASLSKLHGHTDRCREGCFLVCALCVDVSCLSLFFVVDVVTLGRANMNLNMNGAMDGMDQEGLPKSAFMDLQQPQQMPPMHPAYSSIRTSYPSQHHHQHDSVFSNPHNRGAALGYPFAMNTMGPGGYGGAPTHFSMPPYGPTPSPPLRDGKCVHILIIILSLLAMHDIHFSRCGVNCSALYI